MIPSVRWASGAAAVMTAVVLGATGCTGSGGTGGDSPGAASPPPGGWPQPENGRVTERMCDLLTDADYSAYGHRRLPGKPSTQINTTLNEVTCIATLGETLNIGVQPTAEAAKIRYAQVLRDHKERRRSDRRQTILATGVLPGVDESWFDYQTHSDEQSEHPEHEISVRRGALLLSIVLVGVKGEREQDPKAVLTGLAGRVLQRLPGVGATDTGTTHKVEFRVTGAGKARLLTYHAGTGKTVTLRNVRLPWRVEVPFVPSGAGFTPFNVTANTDRQLAAIGCQINVDGRQIAVQRGISSAFCSGNHTG